MEIQFLGTCSGAPTSQRNVSAVALSESKGKAWYLIDCGEATQHQLLRSHHTLNTLEAVFLTHMHGDHCYGLPGLLATAGFNGRTKPLKIVAPEGAKEWLTLTAKICHLHLPYELEFIPSETMHLQEFGQFNVSTVTLSHRIESYGFVFLERDAQRILDKQKLVKNGVPQGPLWGKLQAGEDVVHEEQLYTAAQYNSLSGKPRKVIICGDNDQPDLLESVCTDCDLLVHESTFTEDLAEQAKSVGHTFAREIAGFAEKVGVPNLILTHLSARYGTTDAIHKEAGDAYSGNVHVANDFDRFKLNTNSVLELLDDTGG